MRFRRRLLSGAIAAMAVLGTLAGSSAAFAATKTPSSSAQIKHGGTFRIVDNGLTWSSLDPEQSSNVALLFTYRPMFDSLFIYNTKNQIEPMLATGYSVSANRLAVTITLRPGVTFTDGTPLNGEAVALDLMRMASPSADSECSAYFTTLTSATALGTYKVVANFSAPYGAFQQVLAGDTCGMIGSPTAYSSEGAAGFAQRPVGTGPYEYVSQISNQQIVMNRNPHYWIKGEPYFNTLILNSIGSDQSCVDAVESGTAQMCAGVTAQDMPLVAGVKAIHTLFDPAASVDNVRLNMSKPPFNNVWARRALANAINSTVLARTLEGRYGTPTESYETPSCWCFTGNRVKGYPQYSVALAKADVAKLPGGTLTFQLQIQNTNDQINLADAIVSYLNAAGITAQIDPLTGTALRADFHSLSYQAGLTTTYSFPDPDDLYWRNFDSSSNNNQVGINDPKIDTLTTEARETVSQPQRKKLYDQVQAQLALDLPLIALFTVPVPTYVARNVKGFVTFGTSDATFNSMYLS